MNAQVQTLVIEGPAMLAKRFAGHDVRSQPEEGDEGGDAGELVAGRDLRFTSLVLDEAQAQQLVGPLVWQSFFDGSPDRGRKRLYTSFSKIPLDDVYKNCTAVITFGVGKSVVEIERATFKNLKVVFSKTGADLELNLTVVGARPRCLETLDLEDFGGKPVDLELTFGAVNEGAKDQQQLPLSTAAVTSIDKTRVLAPGQAEAEAEAERQLGEALRGLEGQPDKAA